MKGRIEWLDTEKSIAILAVVLLHTAASVFSHSSVGSFEWWVGNIFDASVRWAVPVFIFVSGYLFITSQLHFRESLRKIYQRLVVPLLLWIVIYFFWNYIKFFLKGDLANFNYIINILRGTPHYHFWYIYMVILSSILFIPISSFIKSTSQFKLRFLIFMFFISVSVAYIFFSDSISGVFFWPLIYSPFFMLGFYLCKFVNVFISLRSFFIFIIVFTCSISLLMFYTYDNKTLPTLYAYSSFNPLIVVFSIVVFLGIRSNNRVLSRVFFTRYVSKFTLGIFFVHPIFLEAMNFFGFGALNYNPLLSIPLTFISVFLFSYFFCLFMSRFKFLSKLVF